MNGTLIPAAPAIRDRGVAEATSDTSFDGDLSSEISSVPEPSTLGLLGLGGAVCVVGRAWRAGRRAIAAGRTRAGLGDPANP